MDNNLKNSENLTRERYKESNYAEQYKRDYVSSFNFKGLKSRFVAYREIKIIKSFLSRIIKNDMILIDLPCGTGKLGSTLSNFPVQIIAADVSESMLNLAKNEYISNKVDYQVADATNLSFDNNFFDIIVCLRLFQRLEFSTRKKILSEFNRVGKEYVIISYSFDSYWQKSRYFIKRLLNKNTPHFFRKHKQGIHKELNSFGFSILDSKCVSRILSSEIIFLVKKNN